MIYHVIHYAAAYRAGRFYQAPQMAAAKALGVHLCEQNGGNVEIVEWPTGRVAIAFGRRDLPVSYG